MTHLAEDAEVRFQLNIRIFMTQSVELDTKRDRAKRREKEIKKCVDQIEEMNAELHRLRSTYAIQHKACENVDDDDAEIKLELARETLKNIRKLEKETKELEMNLKERNSKMDKLRFKINNLMNEIKNATLNLSFLDMNLEQKQMWDEVRRTVTMEQEGISDPGNRTEGSEGSDAPQPPLGEDNQKDATAPQPSTSSTTTASTSQIASGDGRRRGRKREATTHPKEADKRPRN